MIRYELYFALGGKHTDNAEQVHLEKVLERVCEDFIGYSLHKIKGGWKQPIINGFMNRNKKRHWDMVQEDSYRLTIFTDGLNPDKMSLICDYIKRNFQQEEVMYTEEEVKVVRI